jgi:vang-like
MQSILDHLALCLGFDMSPKAFLEKYLISSPVLQNDNERKSLQTWSLVCDILLSRSIESGTVFMLRQGDVSLLVSVHQLPHFNIVEEVIDPKSNKFVFRLNSETSV